ncbi:hypothetical protein Tco_0365893 [Tanacetum coccineum]
MAALGPSNQLARHAIDELMEFSRETQEMVAMNDPEEFYDALFCLRDDKRVEYNTLMAINDVIAKAEEKLTTKEAHLEIMEAEINPVWSLHYDNSAWLHRVVSAFQDKGAMRLISGQLANLNLADLYDGLDFEMHLQFVFVDDMPNIDEVVFKIHKNRYFEFDPLSEYKWALFYCLPNKSLEQGLKLIHTDNDVHSFFADAERSDEDAALRCSCSSPFSTRIKRKKGKTTEEGLRKKAKGEQKMVDDEHVGRKSVQTSCKGKEIMYEFPGPSPTKESQVSVTNYKRAIVNGKAKMVKVEDVGLVQPTNELPENYCVFEVSYDDVFNEYPLRYEYGKKLTLKLSKSNMMIFSKMLDMLSYKLECEIWAIFVCSPRCSLEKGLTILEGDGDMNKLYDIAKKYGLINLYIPHLPKNLAEYYFKILTLDASDEEVKSKLKSHEKRKLDACSMSPHELVEWEQQEAGSPYLRTPPLKPRRKGIEFPCKNLFGDFLHCDSVADELVLDDNWKYEGLAVDDVGGSSKHYDLLHENVVYCDGHSLPNMDKERFSSNVVLDDVTRRLRKGCGKIVAIGGHGRGLGRLIGLNMDAVDDDLQVTKQVSLPARSTTTEVKDLE